MDYTTNVFASDGTAPGPARCSTPQGVSDDNLEPEEEVTVFEVEVPFDAAPCSLCKLSGRGGFLNLNVGMAIAHQKEYHPRLAPLFRCKLCSREFKTCHGALCHVPKCPGPRRSLPNAVTCPLCGKEYKSKAGVSIHQRTAHPDERNADIARNAGEGGMDGKVRLGKVFSEEEVMTMLSYEDRFLGDARIAQRMSVALPEKSPKQIRDKRATVGYRKRRDEYLASLHLDGLEPAPPVVAPQEPVDLPLAGETVPAFVVPEIVVRVPDTGPSLTEWRRSVIASSLESTNDSKLSEQASVAACVLRQALLYAREDDGAVPQSHIDYIYSLATEWLAPSEPEVRSKRTAARRVKSRRARRWYTYARTQELYKRNPGQLARLVRNGVDYVEASIPLPVDDIRDLYNRLWGHQPEIQPPDFGVAEDPLPMEDVLTHITVEEVRSKIVGMRAAVAVGEDGIGRRELNCGSVFEILHLLFNLLIVCGRTPTQWGVNRTTLILKEGKDGGCVENYRPITINSVIARTFWGILDRKLRSSVEFSPRQKGFVSEQGCFNNVHILSEILRNAKRCKKPLVVTQLDISKAFDTVPHTAIEAALRRKRVPEHVVRLVSASYEVANTLIRQGGQSVEIALRRGVKQGDPLSPFIFNAVMEPLLDRLEEGPGYDISQNGEGCSVAVLAFADDVVLLSGDEHSARAQLSEVEKFLGALGMNLSAHKSVSFQVKPTRDSWYLTDPGLRLATGEGIPVASPGNSLTYLGVEISPWVGIDVREINERLRVTLERVERLALKPPQKVDLVTTYIVPSMTYSLAIATPPVGLLRELDRTIRSSVRRIFHLPQATTSSVIYCRKRDGGLGVPRLERVITVAALKSYLRFSTSSDRVMVALGADMGLQGRVSGLARAARLPWPVTSRDVRTYSGRAKKDELRHWSSLRSQGKSVSAHTDDVIGNAWLAQPDLLKPCRMITAIRMRTNSCGDRVALSRAKMLDDVGCRRCSSKVESLGHILGQCIATKAARIRRHNEIRDLITDNVARLASTEFVLKEPQLQGPDGKNLKPDVVVKSHGRVFVVDFTVRHEDKDGLRRGYTDKVDKYAALCQCLITRFGGDSGEVLPIVVGTRGAMPIDTVQNLKKLGLHDPGILKTVSMIALRCSIELYHEFIDYDYDEPRNPGGRNAV